MLNDCWLELAPFQWPLPNLERAGTIESDEHRWFEGGFALPEYGLQLPVLEGGREVARLVLIGNPEVAVTHRRAVVAVALADQLGSAFAVASADDLARVAEEVPPRGLTTDAFMIVISDAVVEHRNGLTMTSLLRC